MQKLVVKAVSLAIARDGASGGVVRTVTVSIAMLSSMQYTMGTRYLNFKTHENNTSLNS